jgi:hypothetical protein
MSLFRPLHSWSASWDIHYVNTLRPWFFRMRQPFSVFHRISRLTSDPCTTSRELSTTCSGHRSEEAHGD